MSHICEVKHASEKIPCIPLCLTSNIVTVCMFTINNISNLMYPYLHRIIYAQNFHVIEVHESHLHKHLSVAFSACAKLLELKDIAFIQICLVGVYNSARLISITPCLIKKL